jgi:hypothetical protein
LGSISFYDTTINNEETSVFHTDATSLLIRTDSGAEMYLYNGQRPVSELTADKLTVTYKIAAKAGGAPKITQLSGTRQYELTS